MSTRAKKPRTKKAEEPKPVKAARPTVEKPKGRVPQASVLSRHAQTMISRRGKGFSWGELNKASLPAPLAETWKVPTDYRRRSVLEPNVSALKKWYSGTPKKVEPAMPAPPPEEKPVRKRAVRKKPKS